MHVLFLSATLWQSLGSPTRAAGAERALVAASALCIFDVVSRALALDNPLAMSLLLADDGVRILAKLRLYFFFEAASYMIDVGN